MHLVMKFSTNLITNILHLMVYFDEYNNAIIIFQCHVPCCNIDDAGKVMKEKALHYRPACMRALIGSRGDCVGYDSALLLKVAVTVGWM